MRTFMVILTMALLAGAPAAAASPISDAGLIPVSLPSDLPPGTVLTDVGHSVSGWVAVGVDPGAVPRPLDPGLARVVVLTSIDGVTWSRVPLMGDAAAGMMGSIASTQDGFTVVGSAPCIGSELGGGLAPDPQCVAVWRSPDGIAWQRTLADDSQAADALLVDAAATRDVLVLIGCLTISCSEGSAIWRSADGARWDRAQTEGLPSALLMSLGTDGSQIAVTGIDVELGTPLIAVSVDGVAWSQTFSGDVGAGFEFVTAGPDGWLAGGQRREPGDGIKGLVVTSPHGQDWQPVAAAAGPDLFFRAGWSDARTILAGSAPAEPGHRPAAWRLGADGLAELPVAGLEPGIQGELMRVAGAPDGTTVAIGYLDEPTGIRWAMWTLPRRDQAP